MRLPMIAANWKMNTTVDEAARLVRGMLPPLEGIGGVEKVLCPPFISLVTVRGLLRGSSVKLGAQNLFYEAKGAYTGEISPLMLSGICDYVIIGHSERRQHFHETDEIINKKVLAALTTGLVPILCVGESLSQNEAGQTGRVVAGQLNTALAGVDDISRLVVAYEPVWAIGTGRAASGAQANETSGLLRRELAARYGTNAGATRILYGGSVNAANINEYVRQPEIDGALVGGASLKADDFVEIVRQTSAARGAA